MGRHTIDYHKMNFLSQGHWHELAELTITAPKKLPFPATMAFRKNRQYRAGKCLLLFDSSPIADTTIGNTVSNQDFANRIRRIGLNNLQVLLLASIRPITYFLELDFCSNYQTELPGGVTECSESSLAGNVRESFEESGLTNQNSIVQVTQLVPETAYDGGSHVELQSISAAITVERPKPPAKEGINPDLCQLIPLLEADKWLRARQNEGHLVEGYTFAALNALCSLLHGGWDNLR